LIKQKKKCLIKKERSNNDSTWMKNAWWRKLSNAKYNLIEADAIKTNDLMKTNRSKVINESVELDDFVSLNWEQFHLRIETINMINFDDTRHDLAVRWSSSWKSLSRDRYLECLVWLTHLTNALTHIVCFVIY
jgi:hypothetical protein